MADSKSVKPAAPAPKPPPIRDSKPPAKPASSASKAPEKSAAKPAEKKPPAKAPASGRPAAKKVTTRPKSTRVVTPVKMVERRKLAADEQGGPAIWRLLKDPERMGTIFYDRPNWVDEFAAIVLIVFGLVSLFSLINNSPGAVLANAWSDFIRQLFGFVGAIIVSLMIISAGVLIMLPKIGIQIHMLATRIALIEVAFFMFLGLIHLLANDPQPRALAKSGLGGGFIGWALSSTVSSLLGTLISTIIFGALTLGLIGWAIGIRRKHVRTWVDAGSRHSMVVVKKLQTVPTAIQKARAVPRVRRLNTPQAERLSAAGAANSISARELAPVNQSQPISESDPVPAYTPGQRVPRVRPSGPQARPLSRTEINDDTGTDNIPLPPVTPVKSTPISPVPLRPSVPVPASSLATPPPPDMLPAEDEGDLDPIALPKPSTPMPLKTSKAVPAKTPPAKEPIPVPEKRVRYFTVEDFKEVRIAQKRDNLPSLDLLNDTDLMKPTEQEINNNARIIENTLLDFDIDVEVVDVNVGPTVTLYAVQPFREVQNDQGETVVQRVRVNKIAGLAGDLALALSAKRLRIQPYVPGRSYMGIEVPNKTPSVVALRPVMESDVFAKAFEKPDPDNPGQIRQMPLMVPLGRDVSGVPFVADLATMPHVLIAGTTGSGKSVCITALALSLVLNNTPDRLKLVMLDPKMVELIRFNGLPHLLGPVETDMERIIGVLRWATREMDRRYKLLEVEGARNIEAYNRQLGAARKEEQLPYIALIIDEIGDMMLTRPDEVERTLTRLAQMARAVGMHLVVATQRPSVDIITGLIKANFPARISFAVASGMDSRVILDTTGAETLMGRGDMLYMAPDAAAPRRIQGCYVTDPEIEAVVDYWKKWSVTRPKNSAEEAPWDRGMTRRESLSESDPMLEDAIDLVVREGEASTSMIQRQLGIPYPRAAHLMDLMNELGVLGPMKDGGRAREVLLKLGSDPYKKLMSKYKK